ncbi:MAG: glycosyltransferase family 4 protein [Sedimentisphaerales bacterium]|nr:glycosyltransferase family 4 protein [Sedimentisphaerales bacterium]
MSGRVAIIVERADVALGGAERSMFEVAKALSDCDWETHLLAAKGTGQASNVHVLCADVPSKRVSLKVFEKALKRHLARNRYDIIHSVLPFDFADVYQPRGGTYAEAQRQNAASYPGRLQRLCKSVMVFANRRRAQLLEAERSLCRNANGPIIAGLSHYVVEQFKTHYGTDPKRIVLTPNGVATDRQADSQAADRLRAKVYEMLDLEKTADPLLLLFAAHNFRLKGLDRLIRALPAAIDTATERKPYLIVMGGGKAGPYRRLAARLGVEKHIVFPGRAQNVQEALSISHVGVLPTFYDPASRFILEALAAGKPVITTRFNGATDQFVDGRHGLVVDSPENAEALAEAIAYFTATAHLNKAARAIADDDLKSGISTHRVAGELNALYESILNRRKPS